MEEKSPEYLTRIRGLREDNDRKNMLPDFFMSDSVLIPTMKMVRHVFLWIP